MVKKSLKVDIFCQIIDNFGDIGVTWRLSKQLAQSYGHQVMLWLDQLDTASRFIPQLAPYLQQPHLLNQQKLQIDGVTIAYWQADQDLQSLPAEVVIEAFACELPQSYQLNMVGNTAYWINLEYLSAEAWVEQFHLQSSIQSLNGLRKTFYFPGFTNKTGGLIRENSLLQDIENYRQLNAQSTHLTGNNLKISLFTYPHAAVNALLSALALSPYPIECHIPLTAIQSNLADFFNCDIRAGQHYQKGSLTVITSEFLSQHEYDQLLWQCDLNFVRGEDSLVRAIWAGKPFVWLPYQQSEETHLDKLSALLDCYWGQEANLLASFNWQWANGKVDLAELTQLLEGLDQLSEVSQAKTKKQAQQADLAYQLDNFIQQASANSHPEALI